MEMSNLMKTILEKANATGYFTIDELVILHSNPSYWTWLEKELTNYEHVCPAVLNIADFKEVK
jgi:hypothetical protein